MERGNVAFGHRHDYLKDGETECEICWTLKQMSGNILKGDFFTVTSKKEKTCLPLPGNCYLVTDTESTLRKRMKEDNYYIRSYSKINRIPATMFLLSYG